MSLRSSRRCATSRGSGCSSGIRSAERVIMPRPVRCARRAAAQTSSQFANATDLCLEGDVAPAVAVEKAIEQHYRGTHVVEARVAGGCGYDTQPPQPLGMRLAVLAARVAKVTCFCAGNVRDRLAVVRYLLGHRAESSIGETVTVGVELDVEPTTEGLLHFTAGEQPETSVS